MRPAGTSLLIMTLIAASLLVFIPSVSAVDDDDVRINTYDERLELNAGSSTDFKIVIYNTLPELDGSKDNRRMITVNFTVPDGISAEIDAEDNNFVLGGQGYQSITVTVSADRFTSADTYDIDVFLTVGSLSDDPPVRSATKSIELVISSPLSSGDSYNKILGIFDNPFPAPFDGPAVAALLTFIIWLLIGALFVVILVPLVLHLVLRNHKEEGELLRDELKRFIPMVLILFAIDSSLRVFGASEEIIGSVEGWFNILYIILGAIITWRFYLVFVQYTVANISKNSRMDQQDVDFGSLMRLLGKLVISVVSVTMIVTSLGFNMTAIVTSAGIVSLGITLGAQNILNQFFSGMVLLITHPFRSGDLIKIGNNSAIYKVSSVNIMNTVFRNWDNEETVIMPNNAVSSATIVNLTGDGLIYKVTVYMNISYESDIDLAKSLMEQVALDHPNVITNGTVDLPSTRVTAFQSSSVELRLTGYVYDFNDSGKIGGELRESIFKSFKENGIVLPNPQLDVHLDTVSRDDTPKDL